MKQVSLSNLAATFAVGEFFSLPQSLAIPMLQIWIEYWLWEPHFVIKSRALNWENEYKKLVTELRRVASTNQ
jgi:hypothetical protein